MGTCAPKPAREDPTRDEPSSGPQNPRARNENGTPRSTPMVGGAQQGPSRPGSVTDRHALVNNSIVGKEFYRVPSALGPWASLPV